jgi:hypothetical protein
MARPSCAVAWMWALLPFGAAAWASLASPAAAG